MRVQSFEPMAAVAMRALKCKRILLALFIGSLSVPLTWKFYVAQGRGEPRGLELRAELNADAEYNVTTTTTPLTFVERRRMTKRLRDKESRAKQLFAESASDLARFPSKENYLVLFWTTVFYAPSRFCSSAISRSLPDDCSATNCYLTCDRSRLADADVVLFHVVDVDPAQLPPLRLPHQRWLLWSDEPPHNLRHMSHFYSFPDGIFNWTMTYRLDADITEAYGHYRHRMQSNESVTAEVKKQFETRSKMVVWTVSDCSTPNERMLYADQLAKYTSVDIFGKCRNDNCPRGSPCEQTLFNDYKFHLAFENANCRDYITEKVWRNSFDNFVIPVVMGASKEEYEFALPPHSFIHVSDFETPRHLAEYLTRVASDLVLYAKYFEWKKRFRTNGADQFANKFCSLCALLRDNKQSKVYHNLREWYLQCYPLQFDPARF